MQQIQIQQVRMAPAWRPALSPRVGPSRLGQAAPPTVQTPLPGPSPFPQPPVVIQQVPAPPQPPFIDSALLAAIQDFTGAYVTGMLAYGATYPGQKDVKPSRWAYIFLATTAALVFKGFADLARSRER